MCSLSERRARQHSLAVGFISPPSSRTPDRVYLFSLVFYALLLDTFLANSPTNRSTSIAILFTTVIFISDIRGLRRDISLLFIIVVEYIFCYGFLLFSYFAERRRTVRSVNPTTGDARFVVPIRWTNTSVVNTVEGKKM